MQNQSNCEITFDTQLKSALYSLLSRQQFLFLRPLRHLESGEGSGDEVVVVFNFVDQKKPDGFGGQQ